MAGSLPVVTLFGRTPCGLCDHARQLLEALAPRLGFALEEVDIESDESLAARYLFEIPVVALDGRELLRAPIIAVRLEEVLTEALGR